LEDKDTVCGEEASAVARFDRSRTSLLHPSDAAPGLRTRTTPSAPRSNVRAVPGVLQGTIVFEATPQQFFEGFLMRTFDDEVGGTAGLDSLGLLHESRTRTPRGGIRGLHLQTSGDEGRLVSCDVGAVVDVAVDLRPSSPTYRLWMSMVLDDVDQRSVWLPAGLAHGYQALTNTADLRCRAKRADSPEHAAAIRYDDPELAIPWPLPVTSLTGRDEAALALSVIEPSLSEWFGGQP